MLHNIGLCCIYETDKGGAGGVRGLFLSLIRVFGERPGENLYFSGKRFTWFTKYG